MKVQRRGSDDPRWLELKQQVYSRDKRKDRIQKVLSGKDGLTLLTKVPAPLRTTLDVAHVFPVSTAPHLCYEPDNVVLLNRWSHKNLDNCKHPVTGDRITRKERDEWWERIVGPSTYESLKRRALNPLDD